jgi:hypothetical protein
MRQARVRVEHITKGWWECMDLNTGIITPTAILKDWMRDSIALLNITGQNVEVPDVGLRWSEDVYYLTIKGDLGEGAADE